MTLRRDLNPDQPARGAPDVSVIIPTRDRPSLLRRSMASAVAQEGVAVECIVVDDGSEVPVADVLAAELPPCIRVIRHDSPRGVPASRNAGIAAARGDWLAFLDDDDVWAPHKLRTQLAAARDRDAALAFAGALIVDGHGRPLQASDPPPPGTDLSQVLLTKNVVPGGCSNLIARTTVIRAAGGFDTSFKTLEDWDLHLRLVRLENTAVVPEHLVAYTVHNGNIHCDDEAIEKDLQRLKAKHAAAGRPLGVDREWWLQWRVASHLRTGRRLKAAVGCLRLAAIRPNLRYLGRALSLPLRGDRLLAAIRRLRRSSDPEWSLQAPDWLEAALSRRVG